MNLKRKLKGDFIHSNDIDKIKIDFKQIKSATL